VNVNYYQTGLAYDVRGRQYQTTSPTGTINQTNFDGLGRDTSKQVGTSTANLVTISANTYDNGGVGDSNLTDALAYPGGGAAAEDTRNWFDWRDRKVATKEGVQASEDTTTHRSPPGV
jgi:hypothetical protein